MRHSYIIRKAEEKDLPQIESLQRANLARNVDDAQKEKEGFVSVETDLPLLSQINRDIGILVAKADDKLVGYEMPLGLEHAAQIPLLDPFIKRFTQLDYEERKIRDSRWVIEGQICVSRDYKGLGISEELHKHFIDMLKGRYDLIITEISDQNPKSLHVHTKKLGMKVCDQYHAEGRNWFVLMQDIR